MFSNFITYIPIRERVEKEAAYVCVHTPQPYNDEIDKLRAPYISPTVYVLLDLAKIYISMARTQSNRKYYWIQAAQNVLSLDDI